MPQRVFVTGASGFVGSAVVAELASRGHSVVALSHRGEVKTAGDVKIVRADLFDSSALADAIAMHGCDAVIHLVGIIMEQPRKGRTFERVHVEGTRSVLEAARRADVRRYVHMSALGSRPNAISEYHKTKFRAEELVRSSGLDWTIFQPSLIHGPGGEFLQMEAAWARKAKPPFLFMPYFGGGLAGERGAGLIQPVFVNEVARAFVDAMEKRDAIGKVYPLGGADRLSWPQMHQIAAEVIVGHRRWVAPLPAWLAKSLASVVPSSLLPFNRDQVLMSQEDNVCDMDAFAADFGWRPAGFAETLRSYAHQLKSPVGSVS